MIDYCRFIGSNKGKVQVNANQIKTFLVSIKSSKALYYTLRVKFQCHQSDWLMNVVVADESVIISQCHVTEAAIVRLVIYVLPELTATTIPDKPWSLHNINAILCRNFIIGWPAYKYRWPIENRS